MKNTLIEIFKPTPIELTQEEIEKKIYWRITAGKLQENISNDGKTITFTSTGDGYDNATYTLTITIDTIQYDQANNVW